jgi:hypothetical protein
MDQIDSSKCFPSKMNSLFPLFMFFHFALVFALYFGNSFSKKSNLENIYCFRYCIAYLICFLSIYVDCSIYDCQCFHFLSKMIVHFQLVKHSNSYYSFNSSLIIQYCHFIFLFHPSFQFFHYSIFVLFIFHLFHLFLIIMSNNFCFFL